MITSSAQGIKNEKDPGYGKEKNTEIQRVISIQWWKLRKRLQEVRKVWRAELNERVRREMLEKYIGARSLRPNGLC